MTGLSQGVRAFDRRHPLGWDVAPAMLITAISVNATPRLSPVGIGLLVLVHGAVVFRRRHPLPVLLVAASGVVLSSALLVLTEAGLPWMFLAVWLALFNVGLRVRGRAALVGAIIALIAVSALASPAYAGSAGSAGSVGSAGSAVSAGPVELGERAYPALAVLSMCAASFLLGLQIFSRREQLAAQRAEAARSAVLAERSRIAQEIHDIIGHNLSVITSLATGGAVAARTSPAEAVQAFDAIGAVSRSSVRDVQRVLSVLRQDSSADGASLSPQPGLGAIPALVESVRAAGLRVGLTSTGELGGMSAGRQLAVYRIVQESLTNALRHAGAHAHVDVTIAHEPGGLVIMVTDDGRAGSAPEPGAESGTGQGITGMRERVEAYGGSLEAGAAQCGWTVRARIPATGRERR